MEDSIKVAITCGSCGKQFKFTKPGKAGKYGINCPYCQTKNIFEVSEEQKSESESVDTGLLEDGSYRFICENNSCKQIVKVPANMIHSGDNTIKCPKCSTSNTFFIEPNENEILKCQTHDCSGQLEFPENHGDGIFSAECSLCHAEYKILVQEGKVIKVSQVTPPPAPSAIKRPPMKLVLDKIFGRKEYVLNKGSHTVGRLDESAPSDFMVKDNFASAQSLRIDVNLIGNNVRYKMTVLRSTNPVYHNNKELVVGDIIYLDYSDTIKIGKTLIKVQKCKSK